MGYVTPQDAINDARALARRKASLSAAHLRLRGMFAGGILAYAAVVFAPPAGAETA